MAIAKSLVDLIGKTPLLELSNYNNERTRRYSNSKT